ncbi:MAG: DnaD domain protein [Mycoplasmatales bacterium]
MVKVQFFGKKQKINLQNISEFGYYALICEYLNQPELPFTDFAERANLTLGEFKEMLLEFEKRELLKYQLKTTDGMINFTVFLSEITTQTEYYLHKDMSNVGAVFKLSPLLEQQLKTELQTHKITEQQYKYRLCQIAFRDYENEFSNKIVINSEEDYLHYLQTFDPLEIICLNQIELKIEIFEEVFELIETKRYDVTLINLAIDYAITSSIYNNLNFKFVNILLSDWQKAKINTVNEAVLYIREKKELLNKEKSSYVDPQYKYEQQAVEDNEIIESIEELLGKKGTNNE